MGPRAASVILAAAITALSSLSVLADERPVLDIPALLDRAKAGDASAQFELGAAYDWGNGVPANGAEALKWYRMAAEQGHVEAQNSVGSGLQAARQFSEARVWFERAAAQGHALATNNLAYLYDLGLGVKQNRQKAFELYSQSADLGWPEAMWNLANMYGAGQVGKKKNMSMACVWTLRARKHSLPGSDVFSRTTGVFQYLQEELSGQKFSDCQKQAEAWEPKRDPKKGDVQQAVPRDAASPRP
jgi:uncharacterized protein